FNFNEITIFSEIKSSSDVNSIKSNLNISKNQSSDLNLSSNFFYLKSNNTFIPLIFLANHENIINNVLFEKDKSSLLLILNPINSVNNSIIIQIPRSIMDSKTHDNTDNNFTVSLDNKSSKYLEISNKKNVNGISNFESSINKIGNIFNNSNDRVLLIKFDKDTKVIKIAGEDMSKNQNPIESQKALEIFPIAIGDKTMYLKFYIEGGHLKDVVLKQYTTKNKTLELFLNPFIINGSIIIQIPRSIMDSKTHDNIDNNFTVSLDNKSSKYLEINSKKNVNGISNFESSINTIGNIYNNSNDRVLLIKFDKDTKVIKIAGEDMSKNQNPIESHNLIKNENPIIIPIITFIIAISLLIFYFFYKRKKIDFTYLIEKLKNNKNKRQR
ncbi:MAG TPA: hypothetical protein VFX18_05940, partial [Candidatus Nitrosocosmicus sp.]|nr:hypothetical protein [Candidatus Nitrosocosmicus sp.]